MMSPQSGLSQPYKAKPKDLLNDATAGSHQDQATRLYYAYAVLPWLNGVLL